MSAQKSAFRVISFALFIYLAFVSRAQAQLTMTCTLPATAQVGVAYTGASCAATGGTSPYTYSATLPAGLSISSSTGAVSGTPTTAGTTSVTLKVTDANSQTATQTVASFVVAPAALSITCTVPAGAQVGVAYTGASCTAAGGTSPYTYSATLPTGLTISSSTGAISGTPTTAGTTTVTLKVTDANSQTATQTVTSFVVAPAVLSLTCTVPAGAQVGVAYTGASCTAAGGTSPYTYSATLPTGLTISSSTGAISGTPTTAGTTTVTLKVTDANSQTATRTVTSFVVAPAGLSITCTVPSGAQVGVAYTGASCAAAGGTSPYTYSATLPTGLTISSSTGVISGTPTTAGTTTVTLKVTDANSQTATQTVTSFVVAPAALSLTCTVPTGAQVNVVYTGASCAAAGGTSPYTYSATLPTGLTINSSTGVISGTPTTAGTTTVTLKVTDANSQTATQTVTSFVVAPATLSLTCTLPATAQVGVAYTGSACTATGGTTPYTYSGTLPAGLSISSSTGAISGTPTTAGTTTVTLKVTDANSQIATQTVTSFVVAPPALSLTCTVPPNAQVGAAYTGGSCAATGGTTPYTYSATLPAGLSINSSTGAISGTPTTAGTTTVTLKVTDANSQTATQTVASFVVAPPTLTLTCALTGKAEVGVAYTDTTCTPSGGTPSYTFSISAGSLPGGLSINTSTGAITGTPTTAGSYSFTIKVTDSGSQSATQAVASFNVLAALTITCTAPGSGIVGSAYSANCNAAGATSPYTYSVGSGTLPAGLSLNSTNGAITGTLTTAGASTFTIKVTDSSSPAQTATSSSISVTTISVLSITTTTLSNAIVGVSYSASCTATGGTAPYTFAISGGSLPTGLSLNTSTCAITGTSTASGVFNFAIKVTDSGSTAQTATQPLSITANPALSITTTSVPNGSVGLYYTASLSAQNGTAPYTWSPSGGSLPAGLTISSSGLISGTPTTAGSYSFTVKVQDSGSPQQTQTQSFSNVTIAAGLTITTTQIGNGVVGTAYTASLTAQNGAAPYTWSVASGSLPAGLSINGSNISGTPTATGTSYFTIKATDSTTPTAQTATQALSVTIVSGLAFTSTGFAGGTAGVAYSSSCSASGGTAPLTYSVTSGSLPAGLSLNAANCTVSGTPTTTGTSNFTIKVIDSSSPTALSASNSFSITIAAGLTITTTSLPGGTVGQNYSSTLVAQNGATPYGWTILSGALPPGLSLNGGGALTGSPTTKGTYSFTVKVTDNNGVSATQSLSIVVNPASLILSCNLPSGARVGTPYSGACTASGGTAPYTYSLSSGSLPNGLSLSSTTGAITGTPTSTGNFAFTVNVADSGSQTASQAMTGFTVSAPVLTISCYFPTGAQVNIPYTSACTASGGTPPYAFAVSYLPPGLSPSAYGATYTISGTPTAAGVSTFTVSVTDAGSPAQNASQTVSGFAVWAASAPQVPTFSFVGLPTSETAGGTISGTTISLSSSSAAWPISVNLGFTPNAAGVSSGYTDPAMQFVDSSGKGLGTTYSVTIPALTNSVQLPAIAPGTVAGKLGVTLTVTGQTGAAAAFTVPQSAPIITPGTVQILNVTSTGFDVELVANSSPRDLQSANFTFAAAGGTVLNGSSSFTVDLSSIMTAWYSGTTSGQYGSRFSLTQSFTYSGSSAAISSVTVTLTNSVGTSAAITGSK